MLVARLSDHTGIGMRKFVGSVDGHAHGRNLISETDRLLAKAEVLKYAARA